MIHEADGVGEVSWIPIFTGEFLVSNLGSLKFSWIPMEVISKRFFLKKCVLEIVVFHGKIIGSSNLFLVLVESFFPV